MKIQVNDLGAIKTGTIDLSKKLSLFCGPNGTGKTYMGFAIYALTSISNKSITYSYEMDELHIKELIEKNSILIKFDPESVWNYRLEELARINNNLWNLFAVEESRAKDFFKDTSIQLPGDKDEFLNRLNKLHYHFNLKVFDFEIHIEKIIGQPVLTVSVPGSTIKNEDFRNFLRFGFLGRVLPYLAFFPVGKSVIFPVERNSFYTFKDELSARKQDAFDHFEAVANKKQFDTLSLIFNRKLRYPQPIRDGLEVADQLPLIIKRNSPYYDFATSIERELFNGEVKVSENGEVQFVSEKAKSRKLNFHQSSSIVKTLASLVIYLKHLAMKDDLIIIDEPELNLHPANQVLLARLFARLVNNGLRMIISTHSDYIVREINNLIMVSHTGEGIDEMKTEFGYKDDETLNPEDVGAYMFNFRNKTERKLTVKPIVIDQFGFEVSTFDDTITELNQKSEKLYTTILYGKEE